MTSIPTQTPPSIASYILATSFIAVCIGYYIGQGSSIGLFSSSPKSTPPSHNKKSKSKPSWPNSYDVTVHPDSSDEELMTRLKGGGTDEESGDDDDDGEDALNTFEENRGEECKLVLVVRTDLGMGKGKIAAQCSHATLACYKHALAHSLKSSSSLLRRWEATGQAKIALQVPSEEQLELLHAKAVSLGLCAQVVHDAGRTQVASGSATVLGVGPGPKSVVDGVTGGLRLL